MTHPSSRGRSASPVRVAVAIFWSFLGVRRGIGLADDAVKITPMQIAAGGILGCVVLVGSLLAFVNLVVLR